MTSDTKFNLEKIFRLINFIVGAALSLYSYHYKTSFILLGGFFLFNGIVSVIFLVKVREPLWMEIVGTRYLMQKILKEDYNIYMNVVASVISFLLSYYLIFKT